MNRNWTPRQGFLPCLSVQQPWAYLLVQGFKDIENRDWTTNYRGPLLIHAGKKIDENANLMGLAFRLGLMQDALTSWMYATYETGGIVGIAQLVDVVTESDSPWFRGTYGFVLRNTRPLPFKAVRGQLGLFAVEWEGATV